MGVCLQFLDFFLKGNLSLEPHPRRKTHEWLPEQGWQDLMKLTELAANIKGADGQCYQILWAGPQVSVLAPGCLAGVGGVAVQPCWSHHLFTLLWYLLAT